MELSLLAGSCGLEPPGAQGCGAWAPDSRALLGNSEGQADSGCHQDQVRVTFLVLTCTSEVPTLVRIERKSPIRWLGDSAAFEGSPCFGASGFAVAWKTGEVLLGRRFCVGGRPGGGSPGQREPPWF